MPPLFAARYYPAIHPALAKPRIKCILWAMDLRNYQTLIRKIYFKKDSRRGLARTFNWLVEETGELSRAIRQGDVKKIEEEFADCLAWLLSVGSILGIDAERAMKKYSRGCPKCLKKPCRCREKNYKEV